MRVLENVKKFDLSVVGGGVGGYSAAIRAAQLGKKVALISDGPLGGTCLNVGCIPTKVLLHSAKLYEDVNNASKHGICVGDGLSVDWAKVMERKSGVVNTLVSGVEKLLASNQVEYFDGKASFLDERTLVVGKGLKLQSDVVVIATGSVPSIPPIKGIDLPGVIDNEGALCLDKLPKNIVIVGGGVIGMEFAQIFSNLGVGVTILEMLSNIGGPMDSDVAMMARALFVKRGIDVKTSCTVQSIEKTGKKLKVKYSLGGETKEVVGENVLVATGRKPYIEGLGVEKIGLSVDKGHIVVDKYMRTNLRKIYAVGDVSSRIMLAHVAEEQGIVAVEHAFGKNPEAFDYNKVPSCVYTRPEIGFIGMTEEDAKSSGKPYRVGIFALAGNGKTLIEGEEENTFVKLLFDDVYDDLIGAHILGPSATELIAELSLGMHLEATAEEILSTIHPHPTVSEAIKEASMDSLGRAIHALKKKS